MKTEQPTTGPLVIYHADCNDGFAAAWCFWHRYGGFAEFVPGVYNEAPPDATGRNVYLVDFSYKRDVVERMLRDAVSVTLIDHHETAINDLHDLPKLDMYCDQKHSGAMLAWVYLFGKIAPPKLLRYIEDRDLWRFGLDYTRQVHLALCVQPYTFQHWEDMMSYGEHAFDKELIRPGQALLAKHNLDVASSIEATKRYMVIGGYMVQVANVPYGMASDAGNVLATSDPQSFAATYVDTKQHRVFSLRSSATGVNVAQVALGYGGGGHAHAAGFKVARDHDLARV